MHRQAALDLVEAKVIEAGRYDLEEYWQLLEVIAGSCSSKHSKMHKLERANAIRAKIRDNEARIASSAIALADVEGATECS